MKMKRTLGTAVVFALLITFANIGPATALEKTLEFKAKGTGVVTKFDIKLDKKATPGKKTPNESSEVSGKVTRIEDGKEKNSLTAKWTGKRVDSLNGKEVSERIYTVDGKGEKKATITIHCPVKEDATHKASVEWSNDLGQDKIEIDPKEQDTAVKQLVELGLVKEKDK
jgi:hypothetical protein